METRDSDGDAVSFSVANETYRWPISRENPCDTDQ